MIVIDDNSPDQTAQVVRAHRAFGRRVHLLQREGKLDLAAPTREGFRWALERGFDTCVQIDADLSHDPDDIPRSLGRFRMEPMWPSARATTWRSAGVELAARKVIPQRGASRFVRALTGLPLADVTSGFKAIRCDALRNLIGGSLGLRVTGFRWSFITS
jgi:dolichol-phosphate mannosyltransferase